MITSEWFPNNISLNILNILFTSLSPPPFLAVPFGALIHVLLCCTFAIIGYATTSQFHHGFFFPVLYSGHKIFLFSIFLPLIMLFLPHLTHSTLHSPSSFLCFHASIQFPHHRFLSCFPEINPCPQFSSVLVPLYSHLLHSTNITISFLVFHPLSSNTVPFRGMPHALLCSCTFLHKECTSLFLLCILWPRHMHHPFLYPTLHHTATQHFKLILGNSFPLFPFSFLPAISGQVPEPFATMTQLPFLSF